MPSRAERQRLEDFLDNDVPRPTLALVYGRRRIGKSTLLVAQTERRDGFYFEATRVQTPVQLGRLGDALGEHLGVGRIALDNWEQAMEQLLRLGADRPTPVVLDEFGYIVEADGSVPSAIATVLGPGGRVDSQARLVLCGSAIAMMRSLTSGQAPLRGRAGIELVMQPDSFRTAASRLPEPSSLELATQVYAVIGGVVGYATDMVDFDLPATAGDFDRWVVDRVLSPSATLHHEATTLLAEDPTLVRANPLVHHSILGAIANGSVTAGHISNRVGRPVSNLAPALNRLVDAGFVVRHEDPIRAQRPTYSLADPYLQFHYAVLEPYRTSLRRDDLMRVWREELTDPFSSQVRGPVFEMQARDWVAHLASRSTLAGAPTHLGPSYAKVEGTELQIDVLVAEGDEEPSDPADRTVRAIGEAKAGQTVTERQLARLGTIRSAIGPRAARAKLLLFAPAFHEDLLHAADGRPDVELIDLQRLYHGD